jgi:hypothetical protein
MYGPARSQRDEYKGTILRSANAIRKWASENLDNTENRRFELTNDGLGLKVFIRSIRAKELLQRVQQEALSPRFARTVPRLEDSGEWSIWFGYSEPWSLRTTFESIQVGITPTPYGENMSDNPGYGGSEPK